MNVEASLDQRRPIAAALRSGAEQTGFVDRNRVAAARDKRNRGRRQCSADQPRIGAIQRVIELPAASRQDRSEAQRDLSAMLIQNGCVQAGKQRSRTSGIQIRVPQLLDQHLAPLREIVVEDVVDGGQPVRLGQRRSSRSEFRVAPAGGFGNDRELNLVSACSESLGHFLWGQRTAVKEELLGSVAELHAILADGHQLLVNPLRRTFLERVAGRERADAILLHVQQRVLGIVSEELKALPAVRRVAADAVPIVRRSVAEKCRDRRIQVAGVFDDQLIVDEIVDIQQHFEVGVVGAVRVLALQLEKLVVAIREIGSRRDVVDCVPQPLPSIEISVRRIDRVRPGFDFDDVVVLFIATEIRRGIVRLGTFLRLIQAPVLAIDVEVIEIAARVGLSEVALRVPREDVTDKDPPGIGLERPRIILRRPQIELLNDLSTVFAEQRVVQLAVAILLAEEQPQRVFGIAGRAAESAAHAQAGVGLKAVAAVGIDQLDRRRAFPRDGVLRCVDIDPFGRIEQVRQVGDDAERRDRLQRRDHLRPVVRAVHDRRVHAVIEVLPVDRSRRETGRRFLIRRLLQHVGEKQISLRVGVRRLEVFFERGRAEHGRLRDFQRCRVDRSVGRRRSAAVSRVTDRRADRGGLQGDRDRIGEEAVIDAELRVGRLIDVA